MNLTNLFKNVLLASHPVGSIFITTDGDFDPHEKLGGSWELLKDKFLVGAGSTYTLGASGGEAAHTLTVAELPPHSHPVNIFTGSGSINGGISTYANASRGGSQYSAFGDTAEQQGKSHNNLPPYRAVNMWLRTA